MRNLERKERNFLSKLFRAISLYMIIVLCAFFTYITFFGVSDSSSNEQTQGSAPQQATPTEMLLNAFMNSSNVSANASLSVNGEDLSLGATIDAIVDMKTFDFDVSVLLTVGEEEFEISALKNSEEDDFLHFSVNDLKVKLDLADANFSELIENFDFSAVFGDLVSAEDISKILEDIGRVLGLNLSASSLDDLLSEITDKVSIKENTLENGYRFVIYLGNLRVTLDASTDFKTLSASVDMPKIAGYTTKLEIGSIKLDLPESDVSTPTGDEIDISSLMKILENAKIAENAYALSSRINVTVGETEFDGEVSAKIVDTLPILRAKVTAFGTEAYVYYINNRLYLSVENLNLFLDIDNFDYDAITEILNRFDVELDKENFEAISVTLPALSAISVEILENEFNVDINDVIEVGDVEISGVSASFETVTEGDNILPNSLNLAFNMATSDWQNNVQLTLNNIKIGKSAEGLNDTVFGEEPLSLMTKNGLVPVEDFVDLNNLLKIAKTAVQAENITFNLDAKMGQIALSGTGKFDIPSMSFNLDLELNIKENNDKLSLKFFLYGEDIVNTKTIYMTIGERSFKVDITQMNFESLLAEFGVSVDTTGLIEKIESELKIDFESINVLDILKNLELTETKTDVLSYAISLNGNSVIVKFNEETGALSVDFSKMIDGDEVQISLSNILTNAPDFTLFTPTGDEADISKIFDIVEDAKIAEDTYALSSRINVTVGETEFEGEVSAKIVDSLPILRAKVTAFGAEAYVYYINNRLYLSVENLNLFLDIDNFDYDAITEILNRFDVELDKENFEAISVTLPALSAISVEILENEFNVDINDVIEVGDVEISGVSASFETVTEGDNILPNSLNLAFNMATSDWQNNVQLTLNNIKIGKSAEGLNDTVFGEEPLSLMTKNGLVPVEDFVDLNNLLKIAKTAVQAENITFNLDAKMGQIALSGTGKFDIPSMSFNLDLELNIKENNDKLSLKFFLYGEDIVNTKTIYMTIGERSFKVDITQMNFESLLAEFGVSVDTTGLIEKIESELKIDFESINVLDILKNLELTETKTDVLSYAISLNGNSVIVKFNEETGALSVDFSKMIDGDEVQISLSNILTNAPDFTLFTPTGDEADISKIFDIVEDAKIAEDTYALSADLYVRYSASTFEGDILAMLLKDGNNLVPYVRVKTSAMSLETYIYLIDETVYVDLQGLRISADLNEGSINTIMNFITDLGLDVGGLDGLTTAFNVTLPALSTISANWIDGGVRIYAGDIAYTETARFEDIVIDAFGALSNGKVLLDKLVVGANIVNLTDGDANATNVASLSKPFSTSGERNGEFKEDAITSDKNFAVYLTGLRIGQSVLFKEDIVFDENGNVVSLCGNGGVYEVGDFTNYQTLLPLVEKVYNYVTKSNNFQVGLTANIGGNALSGDVVMSLTDDVNSPLFGGRGLKVQGDLTLESGDESKHAFSIYYNSDRDAYDDNGNALSGLFFTYAHNEFIENNTKFRGRIEDGNMSDLISMILGIANVDIDEDNAWNLKNSTTDFSFLHQLLGIGENDIGEDIGKVDGILKDVSSVLKMLKKISFEATDSNYSLIVDFDLGATNADAKSGTITSANIGKIEILFDNSGNLTNISFSLGDDLSANVKILAYNEESFNYFNNNSFDTHHNLSSLPEFMDIAVNTLNTKNVNFKGNISIDLISVITLDMTFDLYANFEEFNNPYIFAQVELQTSTLASWVFNGDFDTRMVTFEYKDGVLTFHRYSITNESGYWKNGWLWTIADWTKVVEDSVDKNTYQSSEILPNITKLVLDAFGIKESFLGINLPDMIISIIESIEVNPTLEETILGFTVDENIENMTLTLDGASLLGDDNAQNLNVNLGAKKYQGFYKNEKGELVEKTYSFIDSITGLNIDLSGVLVTLNLNSVDGDSYQTNGYKLKSSYEDNNGSVVGGRLMYTNNYYRNQYMNSVVA